MLTSITKTVAHTPAKLKRKRADSQPVARAASSAAPKELTHKRRGPYTKNSETTIWRNRRHASDIRRFFPVVDKTRRDREPEPEIIIDESPTIQDKEFVAENELSEEMSRLSYTAAGAESEATFGVEVPYDLATREPLLEETILEPTEVSE